MTHGIKPRAASERIWALFDRPSADECWVWRGATIAGYGHFYAGRIDGQKRWRRAHRVVYELLVGPIPDGLQLDHLCRNPPCVNPAHLEAVTPLENSRRAASRITHCPKGHPLRPLLEMPPYTPRDCQLCANAAERARYARRRAERLGHIYDREGWG